MSRLPGEHPNHWARESLFLHADLGTEIQNGAAPDTGSEPLPSPEYPGAWGSRHYCRGCWYNSPQGEEGTEPGSQSETPRSELSVLEQGLYLLDTNGDASSPAFGNLAPNSAFPAETLWK